MRHVYIIGANEMSGVSTKLQWPESCAGRPASGSFDGRRSVNAAEVSDYVLSVQMCTTKVIVNSIYMWDVATVHRN